MGSKRRLAPELMKIVLKNRKENQYYVEPFMGGCNMLSEVTGNRIGNDYNEYIAEMWNALVNKNWIPPHSISEIEYNDIKKNKNNYPKELVGFTGVAVTFGSKWFGTYARNKRGTNYAMEGRENLLKQIEKLKGVIFKSVSYNELIIPPNSIIYNDPPYFGVAGYKDKFDHNKFWQWCREKSLEGHEVYTSEYNAPDDFECIWSHNLKTNMDAKCEVISIEKLFKYKG